MPAVLRTLSMAEPPTRYASRYLFTTGEALDAGFSDETGGAWDIGAAFESSLVMKLGSGSPHFVHHV
jgi:hypothetical protein